ncbi:MAG: 4-hydroxythreonine-4-phosphate dehydrogenase PdxA [Chitinophagaceae bacterium]|nr:4-hydroxythreonine-4-phosphate dehydrogenase PdxA [Chitinophagaceae bacterium]
MTTEKKIPIVGITIGDINGIGPEIIIKSLLDERILDFFTPVIYGSEEIFDHYMKILNISHFRLHNIETITNISPGKIYIINTQNRKIHIQTGKESQEAGKYALSSLQKAVHDLKNKYIDAIVTAPISKQSMQSDEFSFPGHTEYLAEAFQCNNYIMMMVSAFMKIGLVTGHIPIQQVSQKLTKELVKHKIKIMYNTLQEDFLIARPTISVLGLNPHCGEKGLLGNEEKNIIEPAILELKEENYTVFGPFPSDGFFGNLLYKKYDGIVAMYHDQALIPFKMLSFETGVNYTAGMPYIRTSPDHGTAFSIAGKNIASELSFREAMFLATKLSTNRKEIKSEKKRTTPLSL